MTDLFDIYVIHSNQGLVKSHSTNPFSFCLETNLS
jgi:hypothetical protein